MARKSRRVEQSGRKQSASGPNRSALRALAHAEKRLVAALQELHEARLRVVRRERKLHAARLRAGGVASQVPALIAAPSATASLADDAPAVMDTDVHDAELANDVVAGTSDQRDTDEDAEFDAANARPPSA